MKILCSVLTLWVGFFLQAQNKNTGSISGTIIEAETNIPVPYATVAIAKQGSTTPFSGTTTDIDGNFTINQLSEGSYSLKVSFIGYQDEIIESVVIDKQTSSVKVPAIILKLSAITLEGVEITAKAATVSEKVDKLVYNPDGDLAAQGGSAIDVLKKVPMVTVDINGNVELLGSPGIHFLINGKPSTIFGSSLSDALQSIPASQIQNIEVISNPGARYDAQGTGGVINIILKENTVEGFNSSINTAIGTRTQNGSVNVNFRKRSLGFNAFLGGNNQSKRTTISSKELIDSLGRSLVLQNSRNTPSRNGYKAGMGMDWKITTKDHITAGIKYDEFNRHTHGVSNQRQTSYDAMGIPSDINSFSHATDNFTESSLQYSLGYKHTFDTEGRELNMYAQYNQDQSGFDYVQLQEYADSNTPTSGTSNNSPGTIRERMIEINYVHPIGENVMIETGAKGFSKTMESSLDFKRYDADTQTYLPDALQSYSFIYNRYIYAYYLAASFRLFDYVDVKAGGRYEYTKTTADFPDTSIPAYQTFVPSIALMHKIDDMQLFKMSYSKRIERPDYDELNPFINMADPYNLTTGNPNLRPEIGNNFELGYNKTFEKGPSLNVTTFFRKNTDDVKRYTEFYPTYQEGDITYENVSLTSRANIGQETKIGVSLFSNYAVTSQLSLRSNIMFNTKHIGYHYLETNQDIRGTEYKVNLNIAYDFPHDLSVELFGNYNSKRVGLQGKIPSFMYYTFAARKQFLHNDLSIGLTATNAFNPYIVRTSHIKQSDKTQFSYNKIPYQSFGITLQYKFGNLKFDENDSEEL